MNTTDTRYRWRVLAGSPITAAAALTVDAAYLAGHDGRVLALDLAEGRELAHSQPLGGKLEAGVTLAPVVGRPSSVVVPCTDGNLYLLDAATLVVQRSVAVGGRLRSAALVAGDLAYVGSEDGFVAAVDLRAGIAAGRWRARMAVKGTPALWGRWLLCGSRDGRLYAFDSRHSESEPAWTVAMRHQILASPVVDERLGLAFCGSLDETLYAVDRAGAVRWQARLGGQIVAAAALDAGRLFVGTSAGALHGLDAATGAALWPPLPIGSWLAASPAVWCGLVIVGANDGHLSVVDAAAGKLLWRFPAGAALQATPAFTPDGAVVVPAADGMVYALPWHLRYYDDAATWLEGQRGRDAEAGELWHRAGRREQAFDCLRRAGAWLRLAEIAEGVGHYGEAAHAWEQAAVAHSGEVAQLADYYRRAAATWLLDGRPGEAQRCRRESARLRRAPLLTLTPDPLPTATVGDRITLTACLRNEGLAPAHGIRVVATGHLRAPRQTEVPTLLPGGERAIALVEIEPDQSGTAEIVLTVQYCDANGRAEEPARVILPLQVAHRPVQETHIHGDQVQGDKVGGDKVAGDQAKVLRTAGGNAPFAGDLVRGNQVKIERAAGSAASAPKSCPHCRQPLAPDDLFCQSCGNPAT